MVIGMAKMQKVTVTLPRAAVEAIKVLAGLGEPLAGRLLVCDLRAMAFRNLAVRARPGCPACGGH